LRWQKNTSGLLRFRKEGEGKNKEYEPKLLQGLCTLCLKLIENEKCFLNDSMKGKFLLFSCVMTRN
jgi:hypothetical protein